MPKILTDAAVRKYRGGKTRREIRDCGAQGLFLIVQPSGAKSWALRYRRPDGRPTKLTLGPVDFSGKEPGGEPVVGTPLSLASARALAAEQHRQRKRGIDVAARHVSEKRQKAKASSMPPPIPLLRSPGATLTSMRVRTLGVGAIRLGSSASHIRATAASRS